MSVLIFSIGNTYAAPVRQQNRRMVSKTLYDALKSKSVILTTRSTNRKAHQYFFKTGSNVSFFSATNEATRNIQRYGSNVWLNSFPTISGRNEWLIGISILTPKDAKIETNQIHVLRLCSPLYMKYAKK